MPDYEKTRLSRLTAILTQLQSKQLVTATALAEKHGVSVRTIYRDIRTLERSGIPIVTQEGKGYSIMEGYHLPPVLFSEEEANALITIERLIVHNKDESLKVNVLSAVEKIKAILKFSQKGNADLLGQRVFFSQQQHDTTSNNLMDIQSAIIHFKVLRVTYQSAQQKTTERLIEPFGIYSINGNFLLIAFCRMREDFRVFRIDYIQELIVLDESFTQHDMTMQRFFEEYIRS